MAQSQTPPDEATPSNEAVQEVPITSRQRLLPLLVLCVVMMGVGFYFALGPAPTTDSTQSEDIATEMALWEQEARYDLESLGEVDAVTAPVTLAYTDALPSAWRYVLKQSSAASAPVEVEGSSTLLTFETQPLELDDAWSHQVGFDRVMLRITSPEQAPLGEPVTDQLRKAISSSTLRITMQEMGALEEMLWQNRVNTQVKPVLAIMESAIALLSPVMPRTPVQQGESWYYDVILPGVERDAMTLLGRVNVITTLQGTIKGPQDEVLHVLTQKLKVSSRGELSGENPLSYEVSGEGEGIVLFDAKRGETRRYSMEFGTMLRVTGEGDAPVEVTSTYLFARSPATPEVGEQ